MKKGDSLLIWVSLVVLVIGLFKHSDYLVVGGSLLFVFGALFSN